MPPLALNVALFALLAFAAQADAESASRAFAVARARPPVTGAPRASDVLVRSLVPHPADARDPNDTLRAAGAFHVTRLEWTYRLTREFVQKAKARSLLVGGALEDETAEADGRRTKGRVKGPDGRPKKHKWFAPGRWVGCANAPAYFDLTLAHAKEIVDAGADFIQQDDPQMAVRCDPPLCYCEHCSGKFTAYRREHGAGARYEEFQKESVVAFHRELHRRLDDYAGRHVPFSHNNYIGYSGELDWTAAPFDYVNAEVEAKNAEPRAIDRKVVAAGNMPLVFQFREATVPRNRITLAGCYAAGAIMMMPWDVYMGNQARYFGEPKDYADLSAFIRANAAWLDGYERVAISDSIPANANVATPVIVEGGSGECLALVRAQPGEAHAPVVVHLIEMAAAGRPFTLKLRRSRFFDTPTLSVSLREPLPYDAGLHRLAETTGDYSGLCKVTELSVTTEGDFSVVHVAALGPWALAIVREGI